MTNNYQYNPDAATRNATGGSNLYAASGYTPTTESEIVSRSLNQTETSLIKERHIENL